MMAAAALLLLIDAVLQAVLDACLFEPGSWQAEPHKEMPTMIPPPDRKHLTTPAGLLFNELQKSPTTVVSCVSNMLALALDLDAGRCVMMLLSSTTSPLSSARPVVLSEASLCKLSSCDGASTVPLSRYVPTRSDVIFYVIRLVVRVAGFIGHMLDDFNQVRFLFSACFIRCQTGCCWHSTGASAKVLRDDRDVGVDDE